MSKENSSLKRARSFSEEASMVQAGIEREEVADETPRKDAFSIQPMISIQHLTYRYPGYEDQPPVTALSDVQMEVQPGEFLAILGHNGSGKSTLARLLNAQMKPTDGEIWIDGWNTANEEAVWEIRSRCGMVFQNPDNQMVASVVEEDVAFGPENLGIPLPELRHRVDDALKAVGMYEYRLRAPHELSGGQKQRVAIAGVLAMQPNCIILDEPTAMLDPMGRKEIMQAIQKLQEMKKTIVLITHFMEEAVLADRVIVLDQGKIALEGAPKEVFREVDTMRDLALDVPQVTELAAQLREQGMPIQEDVLTIRELLEAMEPLRTRNQ